MGAIQGAINSLVGTAGTALAAPKAIKAIKENLQEKAFAKAMREQEFAVNMSLKQQQIKTSRAAELYIKRKKKMLKGGTPDAK